jgi:hypothetical protein
VWLRVDEGQTQTTILDSPLVAEIEWGRGGAIRVDFQKLLLARADMRLMVFEARNIERAHATVAELIEQIRAYRHSRKREAVAHGFGVAVA